MTVDEQFVIVVAVVTFVLGGCAGYVWGYAAGMVAAERIFDAHVARARKAEEGKRG